LPDNSPVRTLAEMLKASSWTRSLGPEQLAQVERETLVRDLPVGVRFAARASRSSTGSAWSTGWSR
jgi:hypothetical protein